MISAAAEFKALFNSIKIYLSASSILEKTPPSMSNSTFRLLFSSDDKVKIYLISFSMSFTLSPTSYNSTS